MVPNNSVKIGIDHVAKVTGIVSDFASEIIKLFEKYITKPKTDPKIISFVVFPSLS